MVTLSKVYVAFFISKGKPFATEKIVARNYDRATEIASEWGAQKYGARVKEIRIEKSKGEVLADN